MKMRLAGKARLDAETSETTDNIYIYILIRTHTHIHLCIPYVYAYICLT